MTPPLSILKRLFPSGIPYSVALLVEYKPDSIWYETSLTIAAQALKEEVKTEYHTFLRAPCQIREALTKLGVNPAEKERDEILTVIDSYTAQIGIGAPEESKGKVVDPVIRRTLKISDWSIAVGQDMKRVHGDEEIKENFHIDDSFSVLLQYNEEKSVLDWVRTRNLPSIRSHKALWFLSVATGIASESFYKQLELLCDGILDFKSEEKEGELAHYLRLRAMRGKPFDSRWRKLQVSEHGKVTLAD